MASSLGHHGRAWGSSKEPSWEGTVCAELPGPLPASNRLSLGAFWAGGCPAPTVIWSLGTWTLQGLHPRAPQQPCLPPFVPEKPGVAALGTHLVWVRAEEGDPGYSGVHGSPQSLCSRARPPPSWPPPPAAENRLGVSVGDLRAPEQEGPRSHLARVQRADEYPEAQGREGGCPGLTQQVGDRAATRLPWPPNPGRPRTSLPNGLGAGGRQPHQGLVSTCHDRHWWAMTFEINFWVNHGTRKPPKRPVSAGGFCPVSTSKTCKRFSG